jgi:hypothetical protein
MRTWARTGRFGKINLNLAVNHGSLTGWLDAGCMFNIQIREVVIKNHSKATTLLTVRN